jgi:amino acid adenylation domain-containing protein
MGVFHGELFSESEIDWRGCAMFNKKSPDFRPDKLAELRAKLSSNKLALLEKIKGLEGDPETRPQDIPPRTASGPVPLSFAQQRLWFLDQLVPNSPAYNVVMAFHLSGELKAELLERSINEVIRRHEVLRTTFPSVEGQPCQAIAPSLVLTLPVVDLRNYSEPDRQEQYRKLADEEARYLFDLAQGPLLRATLFRMHDQKSILLLNVQHIVMDGWSMMIFLNELGVLYQAFVLGKASPLPELPIQYADFAIWQRQWLQGELLRSQVDYWKEKLGTEKSDLELPLDYSRPPIQTFHGGSLKFQLPRSLSRAIKGLCEQASATLFMLLITALKVLLQRYTGQNDVIVGTPIANRNRMEIEGLIGFFVNTLVLKTDLSGNPSFEELLERVREVASSAYGHQDLPFEALVDQLQPERNMSQNPLFQVCFVLQNFPRPKNWDFSGLNFERFESISNGTAKFDLWIQVVDIDDTFYIDVEYDSDLFKESTMIRFLDSYQVLLQGIVSNPQQRISELPILTAGERQKLLVEWNDTATAYPQQNSCLHQIIESQVIRTPNAPAVVFNNEQLTYQELDRRANQLANYLNRKGVGPDTLVGICMERSLEMVIGLLGILKAGAAYVPLDPTYPQERLAFMVTDAQPCLLLTQQKLLSSLAEHQAEVLCLDSGWETIGKESGESRGSGVTGDNLAYLIYTSGSTGKPKGAMNTHRGIVNRLLWMQEKYQLDESDRVLQKTPFSFDVSVWEFFWPLMTGACLVVARPEGHKDAAYLTRLIQEEKITTMHFVPSMLYAFLEEREIEGCVTLKRVICSGEALPYALQERFFERLPAELHNLYGPTEAAVDVTSWACRKESPEKFVPIGRPIANTQIYLLDQYLNPVPIGVPGELHIGGVQLARGYWNRLQLTAEKFIPDPFSPKEGARLYKTGDLARYLPDGNIEFLGRIDFQVKIRGFRVELGEVETTSRCPESCCSDP